MPGLRTLPLGGGFCRRSAEHAVHLGTDSPRRTGELQFCCPPSATWVALVTVAKFLRDHPMVESVEYLGLPEHPLHELASKYMWLVDAEYDEQYGKPVNRYGHLMGFCVKGECENTRTAFDALQRIWRATDLGRIKSVATIPAISTHQQQGEEARKLARIPSNLVRLCVGAEHPDDVIADLDQALAKIKTETSVSMIGKTPV